MNIPVTFEDIRHAYEMLELAVGGAFEAQKNVNHLEEKKADLWAELCSVPDFKPGRSNLEQSAKLRAAYPDFMAEYEDALSDLEDEKRKADVWRTRVGSLKAQLDLGKILVAVKEDLSE